MVSKGYGLQRGERGRENGFFKGEDHDEGDNK